ncbi:MAG TPA: PHB depolymerase family esterase [Ktedonobacterales bacterium]|jgi:polyhydroxybutyrate depolymerase|nr:PHB depolymerase family esterase [Ktedonobacterales bacterium]
MRRLLCLAVLGGILLAGCARPSGGSSQATAAAATHGREVTGSIVVGGLKRTYRLHLPPQIAQDAPLPLVLALHGRLGDGAGMSRLTHVSTVADQFGFLVAFPDGYQRSWADGRGATSADKASVDDVAFLRQVIATVRGLYAVDATRIYATGISNGGFMSQRLGCELAGTLAGIASVAATLSVNLAACAPAFPMPYLLIEGTDDPLVPYQGGTVNDERGTVLSAMASLRRWASFDDCTPPLTQNDIPDIVKDGTHILYSGFPSCAGGAQTGLYTVEHGGHAWPGGQQYLPGALIGKTSGNMEASVVIWQFLAQFTRGTQA